MKSFGRDCLALALVLVPLFASACPDGQCERCGWGFCACFPDAACRIVPQEILPGRLGVPEGVVEQPKLRASDIEQITKDVSKTIAKGFDDTVQTLGKAAADTGAEAGRFGRELETAGNALAKYAVSVPAGLSEAAEEAGQRVREGKVVDALWHAALAPVQVQEKATAEAALESDYLRSVGQVAANAYGGPQGAAAYATWLAYHQSGGDASLALRVGILTGASTAAFGAANQIDNVAQRAVVVGAIGGLAVAAAGGSQEAVKQAFLQAGAMVIVQDGLRAISSHELDGRAAEGEAYCMTATASECTPLPEGAITGVDEKGNYQVDMSKVDPRVPAVGLKDHTKLFNESNAVMQGVSRIPGMQAMAVFHDEWAISWDMGALATPATILPAIVVTYVGLGAPYYETLQQTAVDRALNKGKPGPQPRSAMIEPGATRLAEVNVKDSYIQIADGKIGVSLVLEQKPEDVPQWCTGKDRFLRQRSGQMARLMHPQCLRVTNLGNVEEISPSDWDMGCRVLVREGDSWQLKAYSLLDRNKCLPTFNKLVAERPGEGVWYRGDARQRSGVTMAVQK
ncbi:TPA: hypothetical protein L4559_005184 [Pseudomonas aeruginosa]|nr:hypothetical protein [Pseudomonas aeruginosa]